MKDGDYYDRCPHDGCLEVDALHRSEGSGQGARVEQYHDWSIFNADAKSGGCGATWSRTTSSGVKRDAARGVRSLNPTASAGREQFISVPTDAYRANYERAFGHA